MSRLRPALFFLVPFVLGALLAGHGGRRTLSRGLLREREAAASPVGEASLTRAALLDSSPSDLDARYGRLLSAFEGGNALKQRHDLYEAIGEIKAGEIRDLLVRAGRLPWGKRTEVVAALLERWFDMDAPAAQQWVRTHPAEKAGRTVWAKHSPDSALAEAHGSPGAGWAVEAMRAAAASLAGPAPGAQAEALAALPQDMARDKALAGVMTAWVKEDPDAALAFLGVLPPGPARAAAVNSVLPEWVKKDPKRVMEIVGDLLPDLKVRPSGNDLINSIAAAVGKTDPAAAANWAANLPENFRPDAFRAVVKSWAAAEPVSALGWAKATGVDLSQEVIGAAMQSRPQDAVRWIQALPVGEERQRLLFEAVSAYSPLTRAPVGAENASVVIGLLDELSPEARERAAYNLGWGSQHSGKLELVHEWSDRFTDPTLRNAVIEAAARYRAGGLSEDRILEQFPEPMDRDAALSGIAKQQTALNGFAKAVETASRIRDDALRFRALDQILPDWLAREPQKAAAWIQAAPVPPEWKANWSRAARLGAP